MHHVIRCDIFHSPICLIRRIFAIHFCCAHIPCFVFRTKVRINALWSHWDIDHKLYWYLFAKKSQHTYTHTDCRLTRRLAERTRIGVNACAIHMRLVCALAHLWCPNMRIDAWQRTTMGMLNVCNNDKYGLQRSQTDYYKYSGDEWKERTAQTKLS